MIVRDDVPPALVAIEPDERATVRRSGRVLRRGRLTVRAGRGSIAFRVPRGGRYAVTVTPLDGNASSATSRTLVLRRRAV